MSRIALLQQYLDESPKDPFLWFAIAKEYEKLGDTEQALSHYKTLATEFSDYVGTYYHYGQLVQEEGRRDEAEQIYLKGIEVANAQKDMHAKGELMNVLQNLRLGL